MSRWLLAKITVAPLAALFACVLAWAPYALADKADRELAPGVTYEAYLNFETRAERNYDLDTTTADGLVSTEPELGFTLRYDPGRWVRALVNLELSRKDFPENKRHETEQGFELSVTEAYLDIPNLFDRFMLRIGRQSFDDDLEWLYDQEMDGVRLFYEHGQYKAELSVSREHLVDVDFLNADKSDEITNVLALVRRELAADVHLDAYAFYRNEKPFGSRVPEDLLFLGIQSLGKIDAVKYWLNAAYVTGDVRGNTISGFGIDGGATYVFNASYDPAVTFGLAYASGDRDPTDGSDGNFRQSGLHNNDYRFNGVESFSYLGELLEPELSNMWIFTAAAGFRPSRKSSIDAVYHYYRQVEAAASLRQTNLNLTPNGTHKDLGHEIDIIFGYREIEDVHISLILGMFVPGSAFSGHADNAYFAGFEIKSDLQLR